MYYHTGESGWILRSVEQRNYVNYFEYFSKDETYSKWFTKGASKKAVHFTKNKCPPRPEFGSKGHSRRFDSSCAVNGFNKTSVICADNPCSGSSDCFPLSESEFHCVCRPGYEKIGNGDCRMVEPIDNCVGITCGDNAYCMTIGKSFECICNEGYASINYTADTSG